MMHELVIRKAEDNDADTIYSLIAELEQSMEDMDLERFNAVYFANVSQHNMIYMLAEADGCAAGFGSAHIQLLLHHLGPVAEVQELIVTESARGRGVGKALLDSLVSQARARGCCQIEVCCRMFREKSNEFYTRQGFTKTHFKHVQELKR